MVGCRRGDRRDFLIDTYEVSWLSGDPVLFVLDFVLWTGAPLLYLWLRRGHFRRGRGKPSRRSHDAYSRAPAWAVIKTWYYCTALSVRPRVDRLGLRLGNASKAPATSSRLGSV